MVLVAACTPVRPSVELTANGVRVPGVNAGSSYSNRCGGSVGHGVPSPDPIVVPATGSLTLEIATSGPPVGAVSVTVFRGERPAADAPIANNLAGDASRRVVVRDVTPGPYYLFVNVEWSGPFDQGSETYAFRVNVRDATT